MKWQDLKVYDVAASGRATEDLLFSNRAEISLWRTHTQLPVFRAKTDEPNQMHSFNLEKQKQLAEEEKWFISIG